MSQVLSMEEFGYEQKTPGVKPIQQRANLLAKQKNNFFGQDYQPATKKAVEHTSESESISEEKLNFENSDDSFSSDPYDRGEFDDVIVEKLNTDTDDKNATSDSKVTLELYNF